MNIDPYTGKLTATKSETKRFVEARILAEAAGRNSEVETDIAFWENLSADLRQAALIVGSRHLSENGYLKETAAEARVNASVPG